MNLIVENPRITYLFQYEENLRIVIPVLYVHVVMSILLQWITEQSMIYTLHNNPYTLSTSIIETAIISTFCPKIIGTKTRALNIMVRHSERAMITPFPAHFSFSLDQNHDWCIQCSDKKDENISMGENN